MVSLEHQFPLSRLFLQLGLEVGEVLLLVGNLGAEEGLLLVKLGHLDPLDIGKAFAAHHSLPLLRQLALQLVDGGHQPFVDLLHTLKLTELPS